jgi:hypothetical protein
VHALDAHARRTMATKPNEYLQFANCGFSGQTPERFLSMTSNQIRLIPGIGVTLMKAVERYRAQFKQKKKPRAASDVCFRHKADITSAL